MFLPFLIFTFFQENYGKPDSTNTDSVKSFYSKINLENTYKEFETKELEKLKDEVAKFPIIPLRDFFANLLENLYRRQK